MTSRVGSIRHADLVEYLRLSGWSAKGRGGSASALFEHEGNERSTGKPVVVEVVTAPELADYRRRTEEIVCLLADFEGTSLNDMIEAIAAPSSDMLSFAMDSGTVATGSIPLEDSIRMRLAQKGVLLAAAHSAIEARGHFPRMSRTQAVELLANVREGQTARGSYVSRVFVPLRHTVGQLDLDTPPPYERTVTSTLIRALNRISTAVATGTPGSLLEKTENETSAVEDGVSANLLNALTDLRPPGVGGTLTVSVRWAGGWAAPPLPQCVRFSAGEFETLPSLAKQLRDREESIQHTVSGYIVSLKQEHEAAAETGGPGEVVVVTPREDRPGADMRVRISLKGPEYEKALQAHGDAQKIQVVGTLKKKKRRWHLLDPSPISVIVTSEEDDEL